MVKSIHILDEHTNKLVPLGTVVEDTSKFQPEDPSPSEPVSLSFSCQLKPNKEMVKMYRDLTRTMPDRANPHKKRPWRLIRKWFNRYQRPRCKGVGYRIETYAGYIDVVISDVTIHRDKDNKIYFQYHSKPIAEQ